MLIYFLDILGMSFVVSPELNREFGLLEHLQSLTILGICVIACAQIRKAPEDFTKYFFIATGIFSLEVFLEEIDYFIHYYELISSNTIAENSTGSFEGKPRNIHNQGRMRQYIMAMVYSGLVLVFVLGPYIVRKFFSGNRYIKWLVPSHWYYALSLLTMFLLNELTRYLDQNIKDPSITSLNGNTIEFQEAFIYYIAFLYVLELTRKPL